MPLSFFLEKAASFALMPYEKTRFLASTHVPFSGTPRKHPADPERIILVPDPMSSALIYYEFRLSDVEYVERLPSLVNLAGESCVMVRAWVRKGAYALRSTSFVVADTRDFLPGG